MRNQPEMVILSGRIYSLLLLAYPARFRHEFGQEMAQVFRDDLRYTLHESGLAGLLGLWLRVVFDLFKTAFAEHIWEVFHMSIEDLERWTGLAAVLGGGLAIFITFSFSSSGGPEYDALIVFSIAMFLLWAIALAGLYRRLPAASHPGNKVALAIASSSVLLSAVGLLILPLTEFSLPIINFGYSGIGLGIAWMGIIALRYRALGVWSFAPLLLAVAWLAFIISFIMESYSFAGPIPLALILLAGISWVLLGIGLWTSTKDEAGPALPA